MYAPPIYAKTDNKVLVYIYNLTTIYLFPIKSICHVFFSICLKDTLSQTMFK